MAKLTDVLIEAGIIGLLLFAPLPFGSVDGWARAVVEGGVVILLGVLAVRMLTSGELRLTWNPLLWPGLAMAGVVALQLRLGGSVNAYATWDSFRLFLAYLGFLLVLSAHLVTRARVVRLLAILAAWGSCLAVLGLANRLQGRMITPWFPAEHSTVRLISTFVNPNHQALYFAIVFFLALGLLLRPQAASRRSADPGAPDVQRPSWNWRGLPWRLLLVASMTLLGGALLLTLSRSGLAGVVAGLVTVSALGLRGRVGKWTLAPLAGVLVAVVAFAGWFGIEPLVERVSRVGREPFADYRWAIWERTLRMISDGPVFGVGLGAYQDAFPLYRPPGIVSEKIVDYAHNDYLQLGAEVGVPGLLILAWAMIAFVTFVLRRSAFRHDPFVRGLVLGGLGAVVALAVQSALEFGLHMPANALLAVLLGALLPNVAALRTRVGSGGGVDLPVWSRRLSSRMRLVGTLAVAAGLTGATVAVAPPAAADWYVQRAAAVAGGAARSAGAVTMGDLLGAHRDLERAVRLDPGNPSIHDAVAEVAEQLATRIWNYGLAPDGRRLGNSLGARLSASQDYFATAYMAYVRSLQLSPRAARIHDRYARFLGSLEAVRESVRASSSLRVAMDPRLAPILESETSLIPRAVTHLREGIHWDPMNPYRHRNLALFALAHIKGSEATRIAAEEFRTALSVEPRLLAEIVGHLESTGAPRELVFASVPRRDDLMLALARYLDDRGRRDLATLAFEDVLTLASEPTRQVEVRLAYSRSLLRAGNPRGAREQAREALVLAPKHHEVFGALADIYEAMKEGDEMASALTSAIALVGSADPRLANQHRDRLAWHYIRAGRLDEALALRRHMAHAVPDDPRAHLGLGLLLEQQGNWSDAAREYETAKNLGSRDWTLHTEVARAYVRRQMLQEAAGVYETAMQLAPFELDLRAEAAGVFARLGRRERAADEYRKVLAVNPNHEAAKRALNPPGIQPPDLATPSR